ncbi:glycoside hydrolase superfamily [Zychaea mexicana]|uniref:glycoside hydrolase superfamily n=1 Tax=Zychaea mexicana TaxID=64656 RepID=UPI0022FE4BC9|nr:glycoside hydrolase superfamily [Zychaea mexicana]KAI9498793.1 glycoside hydrolase superfamily [Zychaea mexicana]
MKLSLPSLSIAAGLLLASSTFLQQASALSLTIRNDVPGNSSSPILYGLMYEDINRCGDSALYGQMLRNWNFQANDSGGDPELEFWNVIEEGSSLASITLDDEVGLNNANTNSLRLDVKSLDSGRAGFLNKGWWGLRVQPDESYKATFFAKSDGFSGPLNVTLEKAGGGVLASTQVDGLTSDFQKFEVSLKPEDVDEASIDNVFAISVDSEDAVGNSIWFQVFSLFGETYKDRENGLRKDIAETLAALEPKFFRFPGGNNLEGQTIDTRWKWNETIGPLEERKGRMGDWTYWNTNGQGLLDYMYMTEDMGMEPIVDVYAGYSLQGDSVPEDQLGPFVQEAMDELEYLLGDTSTPFGKLRAEHGREEPFKFDMIEIGNEDWFSTTYDYRYKAYYDAITEKYPDKTIISTAAQESRPWDLIDDHYYVTTDEMVNNFDYYDNYARSGNGSGIFVGEFATNTEGCCGNSPANLEAALADGVFITGLERNSDFVKMIAYAPAMKRLDQEQWDPDMIHFDTKSVVVAPFYHVFQMYSTHHSDTILQVDADEGGFDPLYWVSGSNKEKNEIYVKVINLDSEPQPVNFNLKGVKVINYGNATFISGQPADENTLDSPSTIAPKKNTFHIRHQNQFGYTFEPYSATVLTMKIDN